MTADVVAPVWVSGPVVVRAVTVAVGGPAAAAVVAVSSSLPVQTVAVVALLALFGAGREVAS